MKMAAIPPFDTTVETWEDTFDALIERLTASCRLVDPECTDEILQSALGQDELLLGSEKRTLRRT